MSGALTWFEGFVASAGLANLALLVLAAEIVAIIALRGRLSGATKSLLVNAATGIALMLIVRAALLGRPALEIAALFTLAFTLHITDVIVRLRDRR